MKKRYGVYLNESQYTKLKSILSLKGMTVSGWIRIQVKKYIKNNTGG